MADYKLAPIGLLTQGLTVNEEETDGVNLLTFGFVAYCFSPFIQAPGVTYTLWTQSAGVTTTTWAEASGVLYGDC